MSTACTTNLLWFGGSSVVGGLWKIVNSLMVSDSGRFREIQPVELGSRGARMGSTANESFGGSSRFRRFRWQIDKKWNKTEQGRCGRRRWPGREVRGVDRFPQDVNAWWVLNWRWNTSESKIVILRFRKWKTSSFAIWKDTQVITLKKRWLPSPEYAREGGKLHIFNVNLRYNIV